MRELPNELILNGMPFTAGRLREHAVWLSRNSRPEWERSLGDFLSQWLNNSDFVTVSTSGSTGIPKRTRVAKKAMLTSATMTGNFFGLKEKQNALLCLNASYIAGMMMVVRALAFRMNLITVPPGGAPLEYLDENQPVDFAAMVPAQVFKSLETENSLRKLESLGALIIGGAPLSRDLENRIAELKGRIYATFGMTETLSHIALRRLNGADRSGNFMLLPGIRITSDARGCLVADVPYIDVNPLVTNDLVEITSADSFQWLGRADHVINCGGVKLIPEQLERRLSELISGRFFIASQPDQRLGEVPVLVLERGQLKPPEAKELLNQLAEGLLRNERLRSVFTCEDFALTATGKIDRLTSMKNAVRVL